MDKCGPTMDKRPCNYCSEISWLFLMILNVDKDIMVKIIEKTTKYIPKKFSLNYEELHLYFLHLHTNSSWFIRVMYRKKSNIYSELVITSYSTQEIFRKWNWKNCPVNVLTSHLFTREMFQGWTRELPEKVIYIRTLITI